MMTGFGRILFIEWIGKILCYILFAIIAAVNCTARALYDLILWRYTPYLLMAATLGLMVAFRAHQELILIGAFFLTLLCLGVKLTILERKRSQK